MDKPLDAQNYPAIQMDDAGLQSEIKAILTACAIGDPYNEDGKFAANLPNLPRGLRAMAATHWLDISLTLDSITWHFGNFGEARLVTETEAGLRELGLDELALCFRDAKELMLPLLAERTKADDDLNEFLDRKGMREVADDLNRRAWALDNLGPGKSVIYESWIRYARQHPREVFGTLQA